MPWRSSSRWSIGSRMNMPWNGAKSPLAGSSVSHTEQSCATFSSRVMRASRSSARVSGESDASRNAAVRERRIQAAPPSERRSYAARRVAASAEAESRAATSDAGSGTATRRRGAAGTAESARRRVETTPVRRRCRTARRGRCRPARPGSKWMRAPVADRHRSPRPRPRSPTRCRCSERRAASTSIVERAPHLAGQVVDERVPGERRAASPTSSTISRSHRRRRREVRIDREHAGLELAPRSRACCREVARAEVDEHGARSGAAVRERARTSSSDRDEARASQRTSRPRTGDREGDAGPLDVREEPAPARIEAGAAPLVAAVVAARGSRACRGSPRRAGSVARELEGRAVAREADQAIARRAAASLRSRAIRRAATA